ncbi:general transcription factor 3C polypeptide 6-like [Amblyomma americanum]|uniref:Transcription factor TFIIIC triple barrel domain-containing protein n=1 Tax=Amblyomma americanum TaxID=6943 RepID=A0AAQ4E4E4_AMBAM
MAEKEEDEVFVVVELTGVIDSQVMELAGKECTILGIDTPEPVLKLGSYLFTGEYKDTIGTCVLFEECEAGTDDEAGRASSVNRPRRQKELKKLKYFGKTEKRLDMKTSFLQEKAAGRAAELLQPADAPAEDLSTELAVDDG